MIFNKDYKKLMKVDIQMIKTSWKRHICYN